jgi:hypothetical protein
MSIPKQALAAALLGLSVSLAAYAADVAPKEGTASPVQPAPRDTTRPQSTEPQAVPDNRSDETVKDGTVRDNDSEFNIALRECQPLPSPERERCIDKAKEKHGRM